MMIALLVLMLAEAPKADAVLEGPFPKLIWYAAEGELNFENFHKPAEHCGSYFFSAAPRKDDVRIFFFVESDEEDVPYLIQKPIRFVRVALVDVPQPELDVVKDEKHVLLIRISATDYAAAECLPKPQPLPKKDEAPAEESSSSGEQVASRLP